MPLWRKYIICQAMVSEWIYHVANNKIKGSVDVNRSVLRVVMEK